MIEFLYIMGVGMLATLGLLLIVAVVLAFIKFLEHRFDLDFDNSVLWEVLSFLGFSFITGAIIMKGIQ